ncbi:XRE family transcriptional regulator [Photorhabdus caribbeanensis]|uniref:XRE family transcriptional regulator n=1 Tax=Photorhabdus caribbeanensis TaxID=1004165 RepID=UPI001BD2CEF1|nr:helix-turn-helix transcriptional regulator [Photorhabdus caribbeanensis]MBS9422256.1 helix-turn-helix transcriptional regulator [Photorhabdus caribbeanensis]
MKNERIRQSRLKQKITQEALGKRIGVTKATISQWESGVTAPNGKNLVNLARELSVTVDWLLEGVDTDVNNPPEIVANASVIAAFDCGSDEETQLNEDEIEMPFFKEISLSTGKGSTVELDHRGNKLRFARSALLKAGIDPEHAACAYITGDSMEPVLPDGAIVGIDTTNTTIKDGNMYAIEHSGMLRVKILYRVPGGIRIRSYNRCDYADDECIGEKANEIRIIGRVFWYTVTL